MNASQLGAGRVGGGGGSRGCQGGLWLNLFSSTISGSHSMLGGRRRTLIFPNSSASHCSRGSVQPWNPKGMSAVGSAVVQAPPALLTSLGEHWTGSGNCDKRSLGEVGAELGLRSVTYSCVERTLHNKGSIFHCGHRRLTSIF